MTEEMIGKWVADVLDKRAIKTWTPLLFADPPTVANFPMINGISVQPDPKLPMHMLVIRNAEAFYDDDHHISCSAGADMAHLHWGRNS